MPSDGTSEINQRAGRIEENHVRFALDLAYLGIHIIPLNHAKKRVPIPLFSSREGRFMNSELIAMLDYLERERSIKRGAGRGDIQCAAHGLKKNFTSGTRELRIDIDRNLAQFVP